jgi:anti-sigma regulatory factor (Ser/Thr protein kinase)
VTTPDIRQSQFTGALTLAAVPTAVGCARAFVRQQLSRWGLNRLIGDAELVLSELVTNAVNVTGTIDPSPRRSELDNLALITVRLVVTQDSLIVEIWDRDPNPPVRRNPDRADEGGRGLLIVEALCRRWSYFYPVAGGKAVWGELGIPDYALLPSGMPQRQPSRPSTGQQTAKMPDVATLERVLEGLRRLLGRTQAFPRPALAAKPVALGVYRVAQVNRFMSCGRPPLIDQR